MIRAAIVVYGVAVYALLFSTLLYLIGWISGLVVPAHIDYTPPFTDGATTWGAVAINVSLMVAFGLQHSIMARPWFKRLITKVIPKAAERSTFCLATVACFFALFVGWQPLTEPVWQVEGAAAYVLYGLAFTGWAVLLVATFLISHFELFGLAQVFRNFRNRPARGFEFRTPFLYKLVRHPIMLGVLMGIWFTPVMSVGHLLFAGVMTAYVFIGVHFEERDLVAELGDAYVDYQRRVPGIVPVPRRGRRVRPATLRLPEVAQ